MRSVTPVIDLTDILGQVDAPRLYEAATKAVAESGNYAIALKIRECHVRKVVSDAGFGIVGDIEDAEPLTLYGFPVIAVAEPDRFPPNQMLVVGPRLDCAEEDKAASYLYGRPRTQFVKLVGAK